MAGIDRQRVQQAFTLQAGEYDTHATVQKRVIARLADLLRAAPDKPRWVLDIGSGTGRLLREAHRIYPEAELVGLDLAFGMSVTARANLAAHPIAGMLSGDAEALPFGCHTFDLVLSSSTFQWLESLERAFAEASRVVAPGGRFVFAMFGGATLRELRSSYRKAWGLPGGDGDGRTHTFQSRAAVRRELERAGFTKVRVWSETEMEYHPDVPALIRSLKRIGAGNTLPVRSRGLAERRIMLDMMDIYRRRYAVEGLIPATYEVIYGEARKCSEQDR
ncbi:MAG TPA: methyltransferase domain-containing protein [Geobacteraceae bacterium]